MANFRRVCSTVVQLPPFFVLLLPQILYLYGFPRWLSGSESAGDAGSILGSGIPPGGGNGNPLQDSCLGNPMDRGAWWATVHGVAKSRTRLSLCVSACGLARTHTHTHTHTHVYVL